MTCAWFLENVDAYAAGALDAGERAHMDRHLDETASHEGCFEALANALETVSALDRSLEPVPPSRQVWENVLSAFDQTTQVEKDGRDQSRSESGWGESVAWAFAIAASIGLMFAYNVTSKLEDQLQQRSEQVARLSAVESERNQCRGMLEQVSGNSIASRRVLGLLDRAGTRVVALEPQGTHVNRATAIVDAEGGKAWVVSGALPPIAGKDYQLWVIRGSSPPIPAGFLRHESEGRAIGEFDPKVLLEAKYDALAVSLEPQGGRPAPTDVLLIAML